MNAEPDFSSEVLDVLPTFPNFDRGDNLGSDAMTIKKGEIYDSANYKFIEFIDYMEI